MIEMMHAVLARSASTMSMTTSRGSLFCAFAISAIVLPSSGFSSEASTLATMIPSAPPDPAYWFSHSVVDRSMSALTRSRTAGSASRFKSASRPPSRTHGGRHASRPLDARVYGYWFAATSSPCARASSIRFKTAGMRPKLGRYAVFKCQICVRMPASRAMRKTSSSDASIRDGLRALVREVRPSVPGGHLRERDQLLRRRVDVGDVLQRRGDAERALAHRLVDDLVHARDLGGRRGTVLAADDHRADRSRADERRHVDRGAAASRETGSTRRASSNRA